MKFYLTLTYIIVVISICIHPVAANSDSNKSFLDVESILAGWESTYGSIHSMRVSYNNILIDYKPPTKIPESIPPSKRMYIERIESGKRFHIRTSIAEDGFARNESLVEQSFDGKTTMTYWGQQNDGEIVTGLQGRAAEEENILLEYLLLRNMPAPSYLEEKYPNGLPRLVQNFITGIDKYKIIVRPDLESVAGQLCHVVELIRPGAYDEVKREVKDVFWMAHNKGMCVLKFQRYWDEQLQVERVAKEIAVVDMDGIEICYPTKAHRTVFYEDSEVIKYELTVTEFVPNIEVDEEMFRIDFPPGTSVYDKTLGLSYKVAEKDPNNGTD